MDIHGKPHDAQTDDFDNDIHKYANTFQDSIFLGELFEGDMYTLGAHYHISCMASLNNRLINII